MAFLDDVATYITANTTGFTVGGVTGNLGKAQMNDTQPATMVGLFVTAGVGPTYTFSTANTAAAVAYEGVNLQVMSRSTSFQTAYSNAARIYTALSGVTNTTVNSLRYLDIVALQHPYDLGHDDNDRSLVVCNYAVKRAST